MKERNLDFEGNPIKPVIVSDARLKEIRKRRIGITNEDIGVKVRNHWHFKECLIALYPEHPDEDCSCWDNSPDWTL